MKKTIENKKITAEKDVIINKSNVSEKGLFAGKNFLKGDKIIFYDNSKLKGKKHLPDNNHTDYQGRGKYVISYHPYSYINHSCEPNSYVKFRTIASGTVYALRDIKKGEEITYDYGLIDLDGFGKDRSMICQCKSDKCRKTIYMDFLMQPIETQKKYINNLPPSIRRKLKNKYDVIF